MKIRKEVTIKMIEILFLIYIVCLLLSLLNRSYENNNTKEVKSKITINKTTLSMESSNNSGEYILFHQGKTDNFESFFQEIIKSLKNKNFKEKL
ncbi:hypothetical protein DRP43_01220 [candidate division TA06 bacterium]|uniref:Uncharacterized protein n=1 Tax=candidate division TA06 bacterium TaxID=2250710 RepID=A0A660SN70_UNCT6|nr:MAG: hypothetical protein DRP43_01220 [candidate division TA06 bacterium]